MSCRVQVLQTGLQDCGEPEADPEPVGGEVLQDALGGVEQESVDDPLVGEGNAAKAMRRRQAGKVKTTWKWGTASSLSRRASSRLAVALPLHCGQWRLP